MQMDEYQKWPKTPPTLTPEQEVIREDFMRLWHEILPESYAMIEKANHDTLLLRRPKSSEGICKTLEIGAGIGGHLEFEDLSCQEYTAMELREDWVKTIAQRFPQVKTLCGDIEKRLPLEDKSFDRIVAIHVLEHLRNLPQALTEIHRLIKPTGYFSVVIPCEGGLAYSFAREISAKRIFEKKYGMSYDWFIQNEHVSNAQEIVRELEKHFTVSEKQLWPLRVPVVNMNLVMGLTCLPK